MNFPRLLPLAVIIVLIAATIFAQEPRTAPRVVPQTQPAPATLAPLPLGVSTHDLTLEDLTAFLDGLVPAQLQTKDIAGAVITVVKDGKVLFAKGYGFADVDKRKPVSPGDTLFRPGSISKLFTWTSVMQLVEQGKLDLDRDVNEYLDFKIPAAFGKPITLRNIMTHTSGFEETAKELFVSGAADMRPLREYLTDHLPARIFPPGEVPAYSNYATSMAGYIVQRTSGRPFEQYVAENILGPLSMTHTTFVQPLPPDLQPLMSNGYRRASQPAKSYEFVQSFPAGSVATSGLDMCNFMVAHLQNGQFGSAQILKPETAKLMHAKQWGYDPRLNAMALGFYEESKNGQRIIGHGGDTVYFHSQLHLILDQNVGFFMSVNSLGKDPGLGGIDIFGLFMDRYYPFTPPAGEKNLNPKEDIHKVSGPYMASRRADTSFIKVANFAGQLKVSPNADGTISLDLLKDPNGEPKKYEEISPLLFRELHGQSHAAFKPDSNGNMVMSIDYPFFIFQRPGVADNKNFNLAVLIPSLVVLLLTLLFWPVAAAVRRYYDRPLQLTRRDKRMRLAVRLVCLIDLLFLLGWVVLLSRLDDPGSLNRRLDLPIALLMIVGVIGAIGTVIVVINVVREWGQRESGLWRRIHAVVLALACLGFTWFIWHWNLINFKLKF